MTGAYERMVRANQSNRDARTRQGRPVLPPRAALHVPWTTRRREALPPDRVPATAIHPPGPRARRTPGLRREEVAALAGVSVNYYERLEQARAPRPSPQDQADFDGVLPLLSQARRDVLSGWLTRVHPGHPWLAKLARQ
ncbi:helix-turn-helix domain-containing protein [Streptomyces sp. 5-10]|uniref:helix-turn-helix domain-containing protein n=1 Tax=Streptomyces sp. 5-10 TaxID=878925 RepID=UPI003519EE4A